MSHPTPKKRTKTNARGNVTMREPGSRQVADDLGFAEINRACDNFFKRTIPGYQVRNIGGVRR